jgi:hypothetical protein
MENQNKTIDKPVKQKMYVKPEAILNYLLGEEKLHTLITTQGSQVDLFTTDQNLYEALGSIEDRSKIDMNLLVKFLEVTKIRPHEEIAKEQRSVLTLDRVKVINDLLQK